MKLVMLTTVLLLPLSSSVPAPRRFNKIQQEERDVIPLNYGSEMEMDYANDDYLQAAAVKEEEEEAVEAAEAPADALDEDAKEEGTGEEVADAAADPAGGEEVDTEETGKETAVEGAEADEAETETEKKGAAEEETTEGKDDTEGENSVVIEDLIFDNNIKSDKDGIKTMKKISKVIKELNGWMTGLLKYWDTKVEESGAVDGVLNDSGDGKDAEESQNSEADALADGEDKTPEESADVDADKEDAASEAAEDAADEEGGDAAAAADETPAEELAMNGDETAVEEAGGDEAGEEEAAAEDAAPDDADAEAKDEATEAEEPPAERVMQMSRKNLLRKQKRMPNYFDYKK